MGFFKLILVNNFQLSRWWFHILFIFNPKLGEQFDDHIFKWMVQPPTSYPLWKPTWIPKMLVWKPFLVFMFNFWGVSYLKLTFSHLQINGWMMKLTLSKTNLSFCDVDMAEEPRNLHLFTHTPAKNGGWETILSFWDGLFSEALALIFRQGRVII